MMSRRLVLAFTFACFFAGCVSAVSCGRVHSGEDAFYAVRVCYVDGDNETASSLNLTCVDARAGDVFCTPDSSDLLITLSPYDFRLTNTTGNYVYDTVVNVPFLFGLGTLFIIVSILGWGLWNLVKDFT